MQTDLGRKWPESREGSVGMHVKYLIWAGLSPKIVDRCENPARRKTMRLVIKQNWLCNKNKQKELVFSNRDSIRVKNLCGVAVLECNDRTLVQKKVELKGKNITFFECGMSLNQPMLSSNIFHNRQQAFEIFRKCYPKQDSSKRKL